MGILLRYVVLQLPGWGLSAIVLYLLYRWVGMPGWAASGIFALIVAKDAVLYPFVYRAMVAPDQSGAPALVGAAAVVVSRLAPEGTVRLGAELWAAEVRGSGWPIEEGKSVKVREVRGLTLVVEPGEVEVVRLGGGGVPA